MVDQNIEIYTVSRTFHERRRFKYGVIVGSNCKLRIVIGRHKVSNMMVDIT